MNVQHIVDHVQSLKNNKEFYNAPYDVTFFSKLEERFKYRKHKNEEITADDINFLREKFRERWHKYPGSVYFYYKGWVSIANKIAQELSVDRQDFFVPPFSSKEIIQFIDNLLSKYEIQDFDKEIISSLKKNLSNTSEYKLSERDCNFLKQSFDKRWDKIKDNDFNYTVDDSGVNEQWIFLARKLESALLDKKEYNNNIRRCFLHILMYTVTNTQDCHENSEGDTNFFMDVEKVGYYFIYKNTILYSMLAWFRKLTDNSTLTIQRHSPINSISDPVTIQELSNLMASKAKDPVIIEFSGRREQHNGIWDFLVTRVFSDPKNERFNPTYLGLDIVNKMLAILRQLVSDYRVAKQEDNIVQFKKELEIFFDNLYKMKVADVNFIYNQAVLYRSEHKNLFYVFIALHRSTGFNCDAEMLAIQDFIKKLENSRQSLRDNEYYLRCALVSLFVHAFKEESSTLKLFFDKLPKKINTEDIKQTLPSELVSLYNILIGAYTHKKLSEKPYKEIMDGYVIPKIPKPIINQGNLTDSSGSSSGITLHEFLSNLVKGKPENHGGYWFEPEVILIVLVREINRLLSKKEKIDPSMFNVADEVIHTLTQQFSDLQKHLRINIILSRFLSTLGVSVRESLVKQMNEQNLADAQNVFLAECKNHIDNRLSLFGYSTKSITDANKAASKNPDLSPILSLVHAYSHEYDEYVNDKKNAKIPPVCTYLTSLKTPIISVQNNEPLNVGPYHMYTIH